MLLRKLGIAIGLSACVGAVLFLSGALHEPIRLLSFVLGSTVVSLVYGELIKPRNRQPSTEQWGSP